MHILLCISNKPLTLPLVRSCGPTCGRGSTCAARCWTVPGPIGAAQTFYLGKDASDTHHRHIVVTPYPPSQNWQAPDKHKTKLAAPWCHRNPDFMLHASMPTWIARTVGARSGKVASMSMSSPEFCLRHSLASSSPTHLRMSPVHTALVHPDIHQNISRHLRKYGGATGPSKQTVRAQP